MSKCKTQIEIKYELKYKTKNIEYSITVFPPVKKEIFKKPILIFKHLDDNEEHIF